jgi:RimJ/RimL family protein N-acetyltransferase
MKLKGEIMLDFELTDGAIILRPFRLEYAEAHLAGDDEENIRWLSGGVSTMDTVRNFILKSQQYWENDGPIYTFAIFGAKSGQQVGMVESNSNPAHIKELAEGEVNISYNIYPFARGKGYATRAVGLMLTFLKEKGYKTAVLRVNPENQKSLGVAGRAGFSRVGENSPEPGEEMFVIFKKSL